MGDDFRELRNDVKELRQEVADVRSTLVRNTSSLEHHIRRTDLLEESLDLMRVELKPISTHVAVVGALAKIVVFAGSLVGLIAGVLKLTGRT